MKKISSLNQINLSIQIYTVYIYNWQKPKPKKPKQKGNLFWTTNQQQKHREIVFKNTRESVFYIGVAK